MKKRFYWTKETEDELRTLSSKESPYKLAQYFHTTPENIENKIEELGLVGYKCNRWTKEEEQLLIEYSKKYVTKTIARKLNRSYIAVQKKAIKLGIELHSKPDPWKKWMIDYLKENINVKPIGEICSMLNLSYHEVLKKCSELGIEYIKESWTDEEIATLRKYAKKCHYTELVKVLPNRSIGAITAKAYELNIETISDYHKMDKKTAKYIKENWGKIPATEIARNLKLSIGVINRYKKELNLPNTGQHIKWNDTLISKLRKDSKTKTKAQLAKKYKVSEAQIASIARRNGIELISNRKIWNKKLDEELIKLVDEGLSIAQISKQMHIKATTIRQHLKDLDITKYSTAKENSKKWSKEEINILKEMSKTSDISEILLKINKTRRQIVAKARKLGLEIKDSNSRLWTSEESILLRKLSPIYERHMIAKIMERSECCIKDKALELHIPLKIRERKFWTIGEEIKLIDLAKEFTVKEIAYLLDRSTYSVDAKLNYMGLKALASPRFWKEEEIIKLKEIFPNHTIKEMAAILNKTEDAIINKLYDIGIKVASDYNKQWTIDEELELEELLTTYSTYEVAEILGRSEEATVRRALKLGYDIDIKHRKWSKEDEDLLSDLWGYESIEYISTKLNRTQSSIMNRAFVLGLGSQIDNNYDGLKIQEIKEIFKVGRNTILTSWVALGLKLSFRRRSNGSIYSYVTINNLYEFLEANQNIWSSKYLEKNILGIEPEWLIKKRKEDLEKDDMSLSNLTRQQLINANNYYLENEEDNNGNKILVKKNKPVL